MKSIEKVEQRKEIKNIIERATSMVKYNDIKKTEYKNNKEYQKQKKAVLSAKKYLLDNDNKGNVKVVIDNLVKTLDNHLEQHFSKEKEHTNSKAILKLYNEIVDNHAYANGVLHVNESYFIERLPLFDILGFTQELSKEEKEILKDLDTKK